MTPLEDGSNLATPPRQLVGQSDGCLAASDYSVPVRVRLEWTLGFDANVVCLLLGELCKLGAQGWQVQARNLFVKLFRQEVDVVFVLLLFGFQEVEPCKHLICEGARHDKGRMPSCATEVEKSP